MRRPSATRLRLAVLVALGIGGLAAGGLHLDQGAPAPAGAHRAPPAGLRGPLPHGLPVACPGLVISAGFHDPRYRRATHRGHDGIDLVCPAGAPVRATIAGRVVFLGRLWPLGDTVWLQRRGTRVLFAHLRGLARLWLGEWVPPGWVLGWEGRTGLATGPHLHYQVELGEPLDRAVPPTHWPGHAIDPAPTLGRAVPYAF